MKDIWFDRIVFASIVLLGANLAWFALTFTWLPIDMRSFLWLAIIFWVAVTADGETRMLLGICVVALILVMAHYAPLVQGAAHG